MNLPCSVVSDLLPIYIEKMDSEETHRLIDEHLISCKSCQLIYEEMSSRPPVVAFAGINSLNSVNRKLGKRTLSLVTSFMLLLTVAMMFTSWFGGMRGVQEIKGIIVLINPITILSLMAVILGLFLKNYRAGLIARILGFSGVVVMEIIYFLTWYLQTVNQHFSLKRSFSFAYPEFYVGLIVTFIPIILNSLALRKENRR